MTRPTTLPESSFVPVTTRRLKRPELLWQDDTAQAQGFDPERVFCSPAADDLPEAYADETRVEWSDCYGGIGVGAAGGSGRCAAYGGLQTKGVGVTPLVAHDADAAHSSGAQSVLSALPESLFGLVYQSALPFGAVPTLAMLLVHQPVGQSTRSCMARALTIRPFVLRPAHFMRNLLNLQGRQPQGAEAPGLTRDTYRVTQALSLFAAGLQTSLGLDTTDPVATIDQGLRELSRRLAWQFAAGFAKRLPHGSACCSNLSLGGQYLDYGMSQLLPTYRRPTDAIQDPWTESQGGLQTVLLLRQQLEKYFPGVRGSGVASPQELNQLFIATLEQRLCVEMAKMAGLTEDLAQACPAPLLAAWLKPMRDIWLRGGQEPLVPCGATGTWSGLPINPLRPDLNQVFTQAAPHSDAEAMDQAIAPLLADGDLRSRFVAAAMDVRQALRALAGGSAGALDAYLATQAQRKNAVLPELMRDDWFRIALGVQMEAENFEPVAVQRLMSATVARARHTLSDLVPDLPGVSGIEQIQALSGGFNAAGASSPALTIDQACSCRSSTESNQPEPPSNMKKILLILDYFGRWPEWIDVFLLSCAHNPSIDWLINTDCPLPAVQPDNVRFEHISFDDYCRMASDRLDLQFSPYWREDGQPPRPIYTNLCDLRPCYGDLHAQAVGGYDYFGWCDIDLVFGNLRRFLTLEVLEKDVITFSGDLCSGHFTLLKNEARVVHMYQDIPQWRSRIEGRQGYTPWDDCLDEAWLSRLCSPHTRFRAEALEGGVAPEALDCYRHNNAFIREWVTPFIPWSWIDNSRLHPEVWYWRKGELSNWRDGSRAFPYLHFMNFKEHRFVDDALCKMQATWAGQQYVSKDALQGDVVRIDRAGITGMTDAMAEADRRQLQDSWHLARETPIDGLSARQAVQALRAAGVDWSQGCLTDRAGVLPEAHRKALWHEHVGQA